MADTTQFEQFMKNYQDMVYSVAIRMLASETDAEDISQVVFLKAYENFPMLSTNPAAGGWLKTVTTNLCLNHLTRYRARWKFFSEMRSEDSDTEFLDSVAAPDQLDANLAESDYRAVIENVIRKLPDAQRVALVMYHFEDQSYEEIAKRLGVSLSKVKTDIHRARLALKRYLRPEMLGEEFASGAEVEPRDGGNMERGTRNAERRSEPLRKRALANLAAKARAGLSTFPRLSPSLLSHES
jgi:RNA polymerase sigma-70 factor (ECF subfamily)